MLQNLTRRRVLFFFEMRIISFCSGYTEIYKLIYLSLHRKTNRKFFFVYDWVITMLKCSTFFDRKNFPYKLYFVGGKMNDFRHGILWELEWITWKISLDLIAVLRLLDNRFGNSRNISALIENYLRNFLRQKIFCLVPLNFFYSENSLKFKAQCNKMFWN